MEALRMAHEMDLRGHCGVVGTEVSNVRLSGGVTKVESPPQILRRHKRRE
jgi:hypothetical protein